jgi:hypothetical protein
MNRARMIMVNCDAGALLYALASLWVTSLSGLAVRPLIMADSGATRTRRWKLHRAGNHSECKDCDALRGAAAVLVVPVPRDTPGGPVDVQASLEAQARRLEAACEAAPGNAMLEKELRATLLALRGPGDADDDLAKFDAEFARA